MASYAASTIPGALSQSGLGGLASLAGSAGKNKTMGNMVYGALADSYKTQADTASAILYNDAFMASLSKQQLALEGAKTENAKQLAGVEAGLKQSQTRVEGDENRKGYVTVGEQNRLGTVAQGEQDRLGTRTTAEENRKTITHTTDERERGLQMDSNRVERRGGRWFG